MIRFFLVALIPLAVYRDGCYGSRAITGLEDLSDDDYADSDIPEKRKSFPLVRSVDAISWSDQPNICYFTQEGQSESHISCRVRFTRSKFNFNPFGLRFGKREHSDITRAPASSSEALLPTLLRLRARQLALCGELPGRRC